MMNILKIISVCNLDVDRYCQLNDKMSYIFIILLKKVLHHQIFTKIYKYHYFLSIPNLNFKFDTALEDSIQYLTQQ